MPDQHEPILRHATPANHNALADLICVSTNYWYQASGRPPIFTGGPDDCSLFTEVYEALDPGCCITAREPRTGALMGSCFYHPRPTHMSLGIMNVHPNYFGRGVAAKLLRFITDLADSQRKPTRLVSSTMNLDSFSLYTRAGFGPRALYHDMIVPADRAAAAVNGVDLSQTRTATIADLPAISELEWRISKIRRETDWRHFIENAAGIWHVSVHTNVSGEIDGVLASINHPGSNMLGPGVMGDDETAAALIAAELRHHSGRTPLFLVPADRPKLVQTIYSWGGRNVELHVAQVRGAFEPFAGVVMPTFMPETG